MDSRSQIDILGTEDSVVLSLSQDLDDHTNHLRRSVMETVKQMRGKVMQQATDLIDNERTQSRETERRLLCQIDQLQRLLTTRDAELLKQRSINEKLLTLHKEQVQRMKTKELAKEGLRRWHEHVAKKKHNERMAKHLIAVREDKEQRQIFHAWQIDTMKQKQKEELDLKKSEYKRNVARMETEHHTSENKMKLEMLSMKDTLSKEEERREILEERLKAAFMRGVCALNMEAMQVLRNSGGDMDVSVASLLQGMNLTTSTVDSQSAEPASTERLMAQQAFLASQLSDITNQQQQVQEKRSVVQQQELPSRHARFAPSPAETAPALSRVTFNPAHPTVASRTNNTQQQATSTRPKSATGPSSTRRR